MDPHAHTHAHTQQPAFVRISFGSAQYRLTLDLRELVLRRPLGLKLSTEETAGEETMDHFGMWDGTAIVACAVAVRISPSTAKLRQMAVAPHCQRLGWGTTLLAATEDVFRCDSISKVILDARLSAVPFYESLGYLRSGTMFLKVGLPHVRMGKVLG